MIRFGSLGRPLECHPRSAVLAGVGSLAGARPTAARSDMLCALLLRALLCAHAAAAATPAPKPIDLVHASATASSSASSILAQLSAEAAKIESDFEAGVCDVYGKGEWIEAFQEQVAADLGKEAGLFMPTGVCAQQAALSVYAGLPLASRSQLRPSFVTHATSWTSEAATKPWRPGPWLARKLSA